jgi:hypothetical protein
VGFCCIEGHKHNDCNQIMTSYCRHVWGQPNVCQCTRELREPPMYLETNSGYVVHATSQAVRTERVNIDRNLNVVDNRSPDLQADVIVVCSNDNNTHRDNTEMNNNTPISDNLTKTDIIYK